MCGRLQGCCGEGVGGAKLWLNKIKKVQALERTEAQSEAGRLYPPELGPSCSTSGCCCNQLLPVTSESDREKVSITSQQQDRHTTFNNGLLHGTQ